MRYEVKDNSSKSQKLSIILGLAHCDIHPDNILLFPNNGTSINAKLIDYGWSCCFNSTKCGKELSKIVPFCEAEEALLDDKINMDGLVNELREL